MKLCSIVPINDLHITDNRPYHMLLVHLCENEKYLKWASQLNGYKIMDNSIIELGEAASFDKLLEYAFKVNADEIILPDVFKDGKSTIKLVKQYVSEYNKLKKEHPLRKWPKLMAVCHGINLKEFETSFNKLNQIKEIDTIGIPKVVTTWCKNRANLFNIYSKTNKSIHLLGCQYSLSEFSQFTKEMKNKIRTVDTCLPALLSLTGNDALAERDLSRTIQLEVDKINVNNYNKIIKEVDTILE